MSSGRVSAWGTAAIVVVVLSAACGISAGNDDPPACVANGCPNGLKCNGTLGCVECVIDADCSHPTPLCVSGIGRCGACRSSADCPSGMAACWPSDHNCHQACSSNGDCPHQGSTICQLQNGIGTCVGCRSYADCTGMQCNSVNQQCVGCVSNADCPTSQRCLLGQGQCVQCLVNSDCGGDSPVCDTNLYQCRAGCTSSKQCGGTTPICSSITQYCVQCVGNSDCTTAAEPTCGPGNMCTGCASDSDCPAATPICSNSACVAR